MTFEPSGTPKIRFIPRPKPLAEARPMTPEEQACDCGCMDIERAPASELTFYEDPESLQAWQDMAASAGVAKGYVVFRGEDGGLQEVFGGTLLSEGDGKFYWQPNDGGAE